MRVIPYFLYLLLIALHQVILSDVTSVYGVTINLAAFLVLAVAVYKTEVAATWFGFAAGVTVAAGLPLQMGWHALVLVVLGMAAFHVRERLNLDSLYAKLLLMFGGILLHNVFVILINQADGFLFLLWSSALPGAAYTCLVALVYFAFKDGLITYQKLETIF